MFSMYLCIHFSCGKLAPVKLLKLQYLSSYIKRGFQLIVEILFYRQVKSKHIELESILSSDFSSISQTIWLFERQPKVRRGLFLQQWHKRPDLHRRLASLWKLREQ